MCVTYGACLAQSAQLNSLESARIEILGFGFIDFVPMSSINLWTGAILLVSWLHHKPNASPDAVYLVDVEGTVYQLAGTHDLLMKSGVVFDLTMPYGDILACAELLLTAIAQSEYAMEWWNSFVGCALRNKLRGIHLLEFGLEVGKQTHLPEETIQRMMTIKPSQQNRSPLWRANRLHIMVPQHERQWIQHVH